MPARMRNTIDKAMADPKFIEALNKRLEGVETDRDEVMLRAAYEHVHVGPISE